jgi:hypothetical protein
LMTNNSKGITRRQILSGAGAVTASLGVVSLAGCGKSTTGQTEYHWDYESDLVVVGSGVGAATAAVTAIGNGDSVTIIEKAPMFGGTSAKTAGVLWIPNNFALREQGIDDNKADCLKYLVRFSFPEHYNPADPKLGLSDHAYSLLEAFYDNASKATDMLKSSGAVNLAEWRMFALDHPATDYLDHVPENKVPAGRALGPISKDTGTMGGGIDLMTQLESYLTTPAAKEKGAAILLNHRAVRLVVGDNNSVIGIEADNEGKTVRLRARKGVIFGSGGFAHNPKAVMNYQRNHIYGACAIPTATGDFIDIAGAVGAKMANLASAWRVQVVLEHALESPTLAGGVVFPPGDSMLQVNKYGQRAVNEKRNYNDRTEVHSIYDSSRAEFKNQLMFMVYDQRTAEAFAGNYPYPETPTNASHVINADSIEQLAENLQKRLTELAPQTGGVSLDQSFAANLAMTLARFNQFAIAGQDDDFLRGKAKYDTEWHQAFSAMRSDTQWPANQYPNITMHPLSDKGPYYAIILSAGALDTNGGPVVDARARVLDVYEQPIKGLYGVGNCIASPSRDAYWGAGCPLGLSSAYGYIAANDAHTNPVV